jgi:aminotransferase EvaB
MRVVNAVARSHNIKVLEDCAQAHGAVQDGRKAGSMSDIAAFSFYPTKILGAYGDGGMIITNDGALAKRVRRLRMYGCEGTYYSIEHGYNSRLDELQAEILLRKLSRLSGYIERRRVLAARYDRALADCGLKLPAMASGNSHAFYLYVARHRERDRIINELGKRDILVNVSYPWPIHTMQGYAYLGGREGDLPQTEAAATEIFSLPLYPTLSNEEQDYICQVLKDILREHEIKVG